MARGDKYTSLVEKLVSWIIEASDLYSRTREALEGLRGGYYVLALGKAAPAMARAAVDALDRVEGGVVVYPKWMDARVPGGLEVVRGNHPVPDEDSLRAGEALVEWARQAARSRGRLLVLVSGGGSALAEYPRPGLDLEDIVEANRLLLASGASIHEVNTVRKHLSLIKGGWLAKHASPAWVLGLYASDVPGDRLDSIASGPTVPDPTTFGDALRVLDYYELRDSFPRRALRVLEEGARGLLPETPKPGDPVFESVENKLVAANIDVLRSLSERLEALGYRVLVLTSRLEGESREAGRVLASIALEALDRGVPGEPPLALLAGGETTVSLRGGGGRGGRNQELVLSWAERIDYWLPEGDAPLLILAMDTDGIDGASDAAGAWAYPGLARMLRSRGLDPRSLLEAHDSYRALEAAGTLVRTGPLESNLNSVVVMLIGLVDRGE